MRSAYFLLLNLTSLLTFGGNTLKNFAKEIAPYKNTLINSA